MLVFRLCRHPWSSPAAARALMTPRVWNGALLAFVQVEGWGGGGEEGVSGVTGRKLATTSGAQCSPLHQHGRTHMRAHGRTRAPTTSSTPPCTRIPTFPRAHHRTRTFLLGQLESQIFQFAALAKQLGCCARNEVCVRQGPRRPTEKAGAPIRQHASDPTPLAQRVQLCCCGSYSGQHNTVCAFSSAT